MTKRPQIRITLIDRKGPAGCHRGHTVGQSWDFDTQRGEICPMAMHTAFLYIDILRYGGSIPGQKPGQAIFSCPDADTLNIFKVEIVSPQEQPYSVRTQSGTSRFARIKKRGFWYV